eukprot:bmy_17273T0
MENIKTYHGFWFEEAISLITKPDIQMKLPGKFHRVQQAQLYNWRIKQKHRRTEVELPSTPYEALHLPGLKFFPNVYALLKGLCILPVMEVENEPHENGGKHLKAHLRNTLTDLSSSNLVLF